MEETSSELGTVEVQNAGTNGTTTMVDLSALTSEQIKELIAGSVASGKITKKEVSEAAKIKIPEKRKYPLKFAPTLEDLQMVYDAKEEEESLESVIVKLNSLFRTFYREFDGVVHSLEYRSEKEWVLDEKDVYTSPSAAAVAVAGVGKSISGPVFWGFQKND